MSAGIVMSKKQYDFRITWTIDKKKWWQFWKPNYYSINDSLNFRSQVTDIEVTEHPMADGVSGVVVINFRDDVRNGAVSFIEKYREYGNCGTLVIEFLFNDETISTVYLFQVKIINEMYQLSYSSSEPIDHKLSCNFVRKEQKMYEIIS
jgi:hypothetical protein